VAPPQELFLSHSDQDREFVERLADVLTAHGLPVWYSRRAILGARQWHDEIGAALQRCDWFVLVLSPASVASRWVKRELLYALQHERFDERIVPVLHRDCDFEQLSWTLSSFEHEDFAGSFDAGCRAVLRVWGVGYRP
jgi:TIR domain